MFPRRVVFSIYGTYMGARHFHRLFAIIPDEKNCWQGIFPIAETAVCGKMDDFFVG
jgi:hypothetical protein